jgi:cytoskeleton protein RodZ
MSVFGDTLKQARAEKGVTLKEAEQATRINRHHLAALEDENFAVLPPPIYRRGIIRNYATYLGLDPGKALAMYTEASGEDSSYDLVAAVKPLDMPRTWAPNFAIIAFMVVMSAIVFAWIYSISFNQPAATATMPPAIPTVTPIPENRLTLPSPTPVLASLAPQQPILLSPVAPAPAQPVIVTDPGVSTQPLAPAVQPGVGVAPTVQPLATLPAVRPAAPTPIPAPMPTAVPTTAAPAAAAAGTATIRVLSQGDINVTVVADGATVFDGWLGSGGMTDWYTAGTFTVTTSDGSLTMFENANTGQQFYMGYGPYETYTLSG